MVERNHTSANKVHMYTCMKLQKYMYTYTNRPIGDTKHI